MAIFGFGKKDDDAEPAEKRGLLDRLRAGLSKTAQVLATDVRDLFKREGRLVDDAFLEELRGALVRTDMGPAAAEAIVADVKERLRARVVDPDVVIDSIRRQLLERLQATAGGLAMAATGPTVILVTGVNGSGKTTSIAKLANRFVQEGRRVVLGAGDTFRAAAVDQLKIWGERAGVPVLTAPEGSDPASLAFDALARAQADGADLLMVDTAGRLQNRADLMEELAKIVRVLRKRDPEAPHATLLVLDASTGQNALQQVEIFRRIADVTGLVMTKLDGTAKGGVLVALADRHGLPIHAIGVGEQIDDLQPFEPADFARALVGAPG
jgi:fused signal recognition particle receptor